MLIDQKPHIAAIKAAQETWDQVTESGWGGVSRLSAACETYHLAYEAAKTNLVMGGGPSNSVVESGESHERAGSNPALGVDTSPAPAHLIELSEPCLICNDNECDGNSCEMSEDVPIEPKCLEVPLSQLMEWYNSPNAVTYQRWDYFDALCRHVLWLEENRIGARELGAGRTARNGESTSYEESDRTAARPEQPDELCEDEGCPQFGTAHVCINNVQIPETPYRSACEAYARIAGNYALNNAAMERALQAYEATRHKRESGVLTIKDLERAYDAGWEDNESGFNGHDFERYLKDNNLCGHSWKPTNEIEHGATK